MKLWVVVPCKPLSEAKHRLAPYLAPAIRAELSRWLLDRTLRVVSRLPVAQGGPSVGAYCHTPLPWAVAGCVVVSRDEGVLARALQAGALALPEQGHTLNAAVRQASALAVSRGAEALLILPTDLPLLEPEDLAALVAGAPPPSVVIAAACRGGGTNALLLAPPGVIAPAFGRDSRWRHEERAVRAGAAVRVLRSPRLAYDLDTVSDLRQLAAALPQALLLRSGA